MSSERDPNQLSQEAMSDINTALFEAVKVIDVNVEQEGFWERYAVEFDAMVPELRGLIRRVVTGIYPHEQQDRRLRLHPRAKAVEGGLTTGLAMGYWALKGGVQGEQHTFEAAFMRDLTATYEFCYERPGLSRYEFDDMLRLSGGQMASYIRDIASPRLARPYNQNGKPKLDDDNNALCLNAMGYALSEARSILVCNAIFRQQPPDGPAEDALVAAIEEVEDVQPEVDDYIPASRLFPDLFPKLFTEE